MIEKITKVKEAGYSVYGDPLLKDLKEQPESGNFKAELPFQFKYNSSWQVGHTCEKCSKQVLFGEEADSDGRLLPKSFDTLKYLCSKYYKKDFLKDFVKIFEATELKKFEEKYYVISDSIFEEDYPVTSSITPLFYSCPNCKAEYLVRFRQGYPYAPDAGKPEGMPGTIFIDEIVFVKTKGNKKIMELIRENGTD
ncbi:hypothetical protein SAMN04515674_101595 [Pseudarcicella hirudinis]|uniref:Uncharacterized protein n=1 Tax=Pseudarcicella hirudinis TaxID=1079859 RepID=A0A1I5N4Q7_9BACT|nr:hypothetical protein [Pseudarcicella hirudinis]SFP16640.1 hypothetical protein SAMN04515674_101595 [Pseudarcicella hirudinis]